MGMGVTGVVTGHVEAQNSGYLPASTGVFTVLTTDANVPVCAADRQLCSVKCPRQKR